MCHWQPELARLIPQSRGETHAKLTESWKGPLGLEGEILLNMKNFQGFSGHTLALLQRLIMIEGSTTG